MTGEIKTQNLPDMHYLLQITDYHSQFAVYHLQLLAS